MSLEVVSQTFDKYSGGCVLFLPKLYYFWLTAKLSARVKRRNHRNPSISITALVTYQVEPHIRSKLTLHLPCVDKAPSIDSLGLSALTRKNLPLELV